MRSLTDIITFSRSFCQSTRRINLKIVCKKPTRRGIRGFFHFLEHRSGKNCECGNIYGCNCFSPLWGLSQLPSQKGPFERENFEFCSLGFFFSLVLKRPTMWAQRKCVLRSKSLNFAWVLQPLKIMTVPLTTGGDVIVWNVTCHMQTLLWKNGVLQT